MSGSRQRTTPRVVASLVLFAVMLVAAACGGAANSTSSLSPAGSGAVASTVEQASAVASPTPAGNTTVSLTATSAAFSLQAQMVAVVKQVNPSVVQIETDSGLGSGVIYDSRGDIVTNAHVVGSARSFNVTLADGRTTTGSLVGSYTADDTAVIRISASGLTPAVFGDSSKLSVGDFVLAMGNPLGLQSSVTEGIVSALNRQVSESNGVTLPDVIQTSAAINPGNSGGALVDLTGQVVGIPTLQAVDPRFGSSASGIGFAISSNRASFIADQLIASGKVTNSNRAYMGVRLGDTIRGPLITEVVSGGPADKAGMQAGDLVVSIDGTEVSDSLSLIDIVASHRVGDVVKVVVQHQDGTTATLGVTLGELPS